MAPALLFRPERDVDDTGTTNAERAERAEAVMVEYDDVRRLGVAEDHQDALTDILADLMHYADREGLDFAAALRIAADHHEAER